MCGTGKFFFSFRVHRSGGWLACKCARLASILHLYMNNAGNVLGNAHLPLQDFLCFVFVSIGGIFVTRRYRALAKHSQDPVIRWGCALAAILLLATPFRSLLCFDRSGWFRLFCFALFMVCVSVVLAGVSLC